MIGFWRILKRLGNHSDPDSVASKLRRRRLELLIEHIADLPAPTRILDIGGTEEFWLVAGVDRLPECSVTLLNLEPQPTTLPNFSSVAGDARDLREFADGEFDVVFSNSVIEHVGPFSGQAAMAREVRRIGKRYFIQTPNKHFPIEPHFLTPGIQYLPTTARAWLLSRFNLGWWPRMPDPERARAEAESIRLLTRSELAALFPDGELLVERFMGLPKSLMVRGPVSPVSAVAAGH